MSKRRSIAKIVVDKIMDPLYLKRSEDTQSDAILELAMSVKSIGLIEPILVRKVEDHYILVVGWRRLQAHKYLGLGFIDAEVRSFSKDEELYIRYAENDQRERVSAYDECRHIYELFKLKQNKQSDVAKLIRKSEAYVSQHLTVLDSYETVLDALKINDISFAQARELAAFKSKDAAHHYLQFAKGGNASAEMLRQWRLNEETTFDSSDKKAAEGNSDEPVVPGPTPTFFCESCREAKYMRDICYLKLCPECKNSLIAAVMQVQNEQKGGV